MVQHSGDGVRLARQRHHELCKLDHLFDRQLLNLNRKQVLRTALRPRCCCIGGKNTLSGMER